jgi:flagellar L-ring protein precursor FlgH
MTGTLAVTVIGVGMVSDATTMGWLQRMFLSVLTF